MLFCVSLALLLVKDDGSVRDRAGDTVQFRQDFLR
jgi:hypothetical protein